MKIESILVTSNDKVVGNLPWNNNIFNPFVPSPEYVYLDLNKSSWTPNLAQW